MTSLPRIALWILLLISMTGLAFAQDKPVRDELTDEQKRQWDKAVELFEAGNPGAARVEFERIYDESKNPRVLYNVGASYKEQKQYARAVNTWEKQLTFRDKLPPGDIARIETAISVVGQFVSTLKVTANVPGAILYVDGDRIGETPFLEPVRVDTGKKTLRLEKEGYIPQTQIMDIAREVQNEVRFELIAEGRPTQVTISVEGADNATIWMDGRELGKAPYTGMVAEGRHTFEARAPKMEIARQTSEVKFGQPFALTLSLVPALAEGKVKIVTGFEDAEISIDDRVVGHGAWEGVLAEGGHRLTVRKDGYEDYVDDISVSADQERTFRVSMEVARDDAWIYWVITGVAVAAGVGIGSYFVFRPAETSVVQGTLDPGLVTTAFSF